jgi:hypothetical protein
MNIEAFINEALTGLADSRRDGERLKVAGNDYVRPLGKGARPAGKSEVPAHRERALGQAGIGGKAQIGDGSAVDGRGALVSPPKARERHPRTRSRQGRDPSRHGGIVHIVDEISDPGPHAGRASFTSR